jgi:hypothetical protein
MVDPIARTPGALTNAALDVLVERKRQIDVEGYTPEHDDKHDFPYSLEYAAAAYAVGDIALWPWAKGFKKTEHRRDLVKAAALLLAAIDKIDRRKE